MTGGGNEAQVRIVAEQVADTAITRFFAQMQGHAQPKPEIPSPLKWAGAIVAALMTLAATSMAVWVVSTLSNLQVTVARMEERQLGDRTQSRLDKIEERLTQLERRGAGGAGQQ